MMGINSAGCVAAGSPLFPSLTWQLPGETLPHAGRLACSRVISDHPPR